MTKQTNDAAAPATAPVAGGQAPAVILVAPQLGENVGAAARAMANFGLSDLRIVNPRDGWPNEAAAANAATGVHVIEQARLYASTAEAVADLNYVCATTARRRDMIKPVLAPRSAASEMSGRIAAGQGCGILFGHEKSGLSNDDIALADAIVTAPVDPAYASLNLAQAVLLFGYEWIMQREDHSLGRATPVDGPAVEGLQMPDTRPADRGELVAFFEHLESELDACGFLWPPEKRPAMVRNLRNMFNRMGASEQEVRTLRGIVASLVRGRRGTDETS